MIARKISLVSGIYLFVFVLVHLLNLSLGLISVQAMDDARQWMLAPWMNIVGGGLLITSLVVHFFLGMRSLYRRNTLWLSNFDWFQLLLGLAIPPLLLAHMLTAFMLPQLADLHLTYEGVLKLMWIVDPWLGLQQVLGLLAVWLHGCMGLFIWLRMQYWWNKVSLVVYPTVVLLPTLALLGFVEAGKSVIAELQIGAPTKVSSTYASDTARYSPDYASGYGSSAGSAYSEPHSTTSDYGASTADKSRESYGGAAQAGGDYIFGKNIDPVLQKSIRYWYIGYLAVLVLTLLARQFRTNARRGTSTLHFEGEPELRSEAGVTILEISRINDIGHASLCGGKGRCGTCQVRVIDGSEYLDAKGLVERNKLQLIGATDDIRLACQARVRAGTITLEHVLPGYVQAQDMPTNQRSAEPVSSAESI